MGEPGPVRAGHGAYIAAVRCGLEERDVDVASARIGDLGVRTAELHICPASGEFAVPAPAEAFMHWDEENGWSLGLRRDLASGAVLNPVYKGLGVLPDPEDVASWVVVLLTHPELTPSREDHPFRDSADADHEFEAQLAQYAPGR
jgi:hypothetical protein